MHHNIDIHLKLNSYRSTLNLPPETWIHKITVESRKPSSHINKNIIMPFFKQPFLKELRALLFFLDGRVRSQLMNTTVDQVLVFFFFFLHLFWGLSITDWDLIRKLFLVFKKDQGSTYLINWEWWFHWESPARRQDPWGFFSRLLTSPRESLVITKDPQRPQMRSGCDKFVGWWFWGD